MPVIQNHTVGQNCELCRFSRYPSGYLRAPYPGSRRETLFQPCRGHTYYWGRPKGHKGPHAHCYFGGATSGVTYIEKFNQEPQ